MSLLRKAPQGAAKMHRIAKEVSKKKPITPRRKKKLLAASKANSRVKFL